MVKVKYVRTKKRWYNMGILLTLKKPLKNSKKSLNNYSDREIKEIYELETNYSSSESFDKLWNERKKGVIK